MQTKMKMMMVGSSSTANTSTVQNTPGGLNASGGAPAPQAGGIPTPHAGAPVHNRPPPPAHVTQLTSSPSLAAVHHPPTQQPHYSRQLPPMSSPQRSRSRSQGGSGAASRVPSQHYPNNLPMMAPSPAHQLLPSSVNSPSLIPQHIPVSSFLPPPLHVSSPRSPAAQLRLVPPSTTDNVIMPPHAFKKLTRPPAEDDSNEGQEVGRRNLVSPRQRERRNFFSHAALQDHNYCAVPPPSPPRSPTPPLSPFPVNNLGAPQPAHQEPANDQQQSFSFGIAGYNKSSAAANVGAYPSPHYLGPQVQTQSSPLSRLKQTIEEAGVGPMTPLADMEASPLSGDKSHDSRPSPDRDGGEETETAPEAEDEGADDAVTRCVCEYLHDDGFMICCDKCSVWQHVVCMGLDKNNLPDEYLCEKCEPRTVDKKRAKALQRAREKEIYKTIPIDSSDDDRKVSGTFKGRKVGIRKGLGMKKAAGTGFQERKGEKKVAKKQGKRRSLKNESGVGVGVGAMKPESKKPSPRKTLPRRKSASATDVETEEENPNDAMALRSWIDTYEEAVTNHYSPELRARLQGTKLPTNQFKPKEVNGIRERCNVSLRGNGMKALTANSYIPANTPVIECRGKYMLASQLSSRGRAAEFVLFHRINQDLEVCIDSKTYGNDSRFCRRADSKSADFNAEVKHHLDKGSLHLYIVSTKAIEKNQEILLNPDNKNGFLPPLSIQDELRQIKKVNGLIDEKKSRKNVNAKRRLKRETVKKELMDSSSEDDVPVSIRKTRSNAVGDKQEKSVNFNLKQEMPKIVKEEVLKPEPVGNEPGAKEVKELKDVKESIKVEKIKPKSQPVIEAEVMPEVKPEKLQALKIEIKEEKEKAPSTAASEDKLMQKSPELSGTEMKSPDSAGPGAPAKSPGKPVLGLPDQSGLIVGVNTINYDVGLRNKSKTREEKKMEMILKAIEAMERAEARKKSDNAESGSERSGSVKRRRSNSCKKENGDSNLEGSSGDEAMADEEKPERPKISKGKRRRNLSMRRRSRAKSGDSTSAVSADESGLNIDSESTATPGDNQPFKFPFKKQLAVDTFIADSEEVDDDVSGHYIRSSRSPPGIANHLLRSAVTNHAGLKSPTKSMVGSAKKRWLRAAMSEDHSEDGLGLAGSSPGQSMAGGSPGQAAGSPEPDYTPLKKRRLQTYNESTEEKAKVEEKVQEEDKAKPVEVQVTEKIKSLPNGLKKRLISNLNLDKVLDKAMQDKFPDTPQTNEELEKEIEKDNTDKPEAESPAKKKTKLAVKKGKAAKANNDRIEENGVDTLEETEAKNSSAVCDVDDTNPTSEQEHSDNKAETEINKVVEKVLKAEEEKVETDSTGPPQSAQTSKLKDVEDKPPTPVQHSVFKSFFSTELSFDDIDRQIEAKRMELARESSVNSVMSPRYESLMEESSNKTPIQPQTVSHLQSSAQSPSTPTVKKRVTIADYKKRKQAISRAEPKEDSLDKPSAESVLNTSSILSSVTTLPELPGLESKKAKSPVLELKKTRSNSPFAEKKTSRTSPQLNEIKTRTSSPGLDRRARASSPFAERRYRAGSPDVRSRIGSSARGREKTGSPRKLGSVQQRIEKWEAKPSKDLAANKARVSVPPVSNSLKRGREPPAASKPAPPAPLYAPRPHIPAPDEPREDLTERLRKEFGLNIEDSDGDDSESSGPTTGPEIEFQARTRTTTTTNGPGPEPTGWKDDCGSYWNRDTLRHEPSQRNSQL